MTGFVPLTAQALLWLADKPSWNALRAALLATAIAAGVLLVLVRLLPWRLLVSARRSLSAIGAAAERVAGDDLGARVDVRGPGRELAELGASFNAVVDEHKRRILNQKLEVAETAELRSASKRLIEECLFAREPLAKSHPWLASAYAEAAIRHSGSNGNEDSTVDALVNSVDSASIHDRSRENLRWAPENVTVEIPVPSRLLNMSVGGMAVESNRGLPVGGNWVFRVGTRAVAYDIPGKVRWCRLERTVKLADEVRPIYRTGVAFETKLTGSAFDFFSSAAGAGAERTQTAP